MRIYTSSSDPLDFCKSCAPDEDEAEELYTWALDRTVEEIASATTKITRRTRGPAIAARPAAKS
jgi:hypothetical protein